MTQLVIYIYIEEILIFKNKEDIKPSHTFNKNENNPKLDEPIKRCFKNCNNINNIYFYCNECIDNKSNQPNNSDSYRNECFEYIKRCYCRVFCFGCANTEKTRCKRGTPVVQDISVQTVIYNYLVLFYRFVLCVDLCQLIQTSH